MHVCRCILQTCPSPAAAHTAVCQHWVQPGARRLSEFNILQGPSCGVKCALVDLEPHRACSVAVVASWTLQVKAHLNVKKSLQPGWSSAWLQRPLDPQLLEYAVYDVQSILALYQHFKNKGACAHALFAGLHRPVLGVHVLPHTARKELSMGWKVAGDAHVCCHDCQRSLHTSAAVSNLVTPPLWLMVVCVTLHILLYHSQAASLQYACPSIRGCSRDGRPAAACRLA